MSRTIIVRPFDASAHRPGSSGFFGFCAYCRGSGRDVLATHDRVMVDKDGRRTVVAVCVKHTGGKEKGED